MDKQQVLRFIMVHNGWLISGFNDQCLSDTWPKFKFEYVDIWFFVYLKTTGDSC